MEKFKYKKSLGQNFLKDENILRKIKTSVEVMEKDLIVEIGPGQGALTKYLKEFNATLLCFEIDERVKPFLEKYEGDKTKIYFEDFLNVDIKRILDEYRYDNVYVVANLPYYITTAIINKIIESGINPKEMVLMVQNEVADRFTASPGSRDYGSITVFFNYHFEIEKLFFVGRKCFDPAPNVDSAVIKFKQKEEKLEVLDKDAFFKLIKAAFQFKRKNIKNNLKSYDLNIVEKVLKDHGMDLTCRAEQLNLKVFVDLANSLKDS